MLENDILFQERIEICKKCPLYKEHSLYGAICDSNKYISPDGTKWSYLRKDGYIRGCSCHLLKKCRNPKNHCIINKW